MYLCFDVEMGDGNKPLDFCESNEDIFIEFFATVPHFRPHRYYRYLIWVPSSVVGTFCSDVHMQEYHCTLYCELAYHSIVCLILTVYYARSRLVG